MTPEQTVVSLELARELDDRGIEAESYYYWVQGKSKEWKPLPFERAMNTTQFQSFPAPQTDELEKLLPEKYQVVNLDGIFTAAKCRGCLGKLIEFTLLFDQPQHSRAEVTGWLLIYLHDNQLLPKEMKG